MPKDIDTPDMPPPTDAQKLDEVTEDAFDTLMTQAVSMKLLWVKPMGLMYLPTQAITQQFKDACAAVIKDLQSHGDAVPGK